MIAFEDVTFEYLEGEHVLHRVNFTAREGETIALVGESGGGKSTIVNLLLGLYPITRGRLRVCGEELSELDVEKLRALLAAEATAMRDYKDGSPNWLNARLQVERAAVNALPALLDAYADRERAYELPDVWAGRVVTAPGAVSGWHHHDTNTSSLYVVSGILRFEFEGYDGHLDAAAGDFVHVPPYTVHRESNPTDEPSVAVVMK